MYGYHIRLAFAETYARVGNATHSLRKVLGDERANRMQPHTLRAKASTLLNDYRTVALIDEFKAEMEAKGIPLPHYRKPTERTDLFEDPPTKLDILSDEKRERSVNKRSRAEAYNPYSRIDRLQAEIIRKITKELR